MDIKIPRKSQANSKDKPASLINPKKKITPTPPSINIKNSKTGKKTKKSNLNRFHLLKNLNGFFFIWALLFIVLYIRTPSAINNSRNIKSLLSQSGSLSEIFGNIAYAPLKLVIFSLDKLGILNIFSLRIMLAAIIFISLFFFYRVCLMWTRRKTAWLITLMLSTSTFFF